MPDATAPYEEFGLLHENAEEMGLPFDSPPPVGRVFVDVDPDRRMSAIRFGDSPPQLVLLHGGAQNAHTWDSVVLALGKPVVAIDLPGHGHSDGPRNGPHEVDGLAADVAVAIERLAPDAAGVVGMSLGGITSIALVAARPDLVRRQVLVDITPGVTGNKSRSVIDFVNGPETFASFDELLERTIAFNPERSVSSLRRGILHNAVQQEDGTWVWRWARFRSPLSRGDDRGGSEPAEPAVHYGPLWDAIGAATAPLMLVRGMKSTVVDDADEAELKRRRPGVRIEHVENAGHSIQGDAPQELAALLADFVP